MSFLKNYHFFPYKVWLTTIVCGSYLFYIFHLIEKGFESRPLELDDFTFGLVTPFYLAFAASIYSLPALLAYVFIFYLTLPFASSKLQKTILTLTTVVSILLTFRVQDLDSMGRDVRLLLPYCIAGVFSNVYYKIRYPSHLQPVTKA